MAASQDQSLDIAFDKGLQMAFPAVMVQLLQALLEPEPSFAVIAGFVKKDPMLVAKVLHMVNTAHYSFREKITDIDRAAVAIGTGDLFKLVLSLSLQKRLSPTFERKAEHLFGDWRLTLWSAHAAEAIAGRFCPGRESQAYLAGLLKDLQLYLAFCREEVPPFLRRAELVTLPSEEQFAEELDFWDSTHPDLAHAIFLFWGFPLEMAEAVADHHDFQNVARHSPLARSVIYATRWAELLHAPDADPGSLVPFELALAKEMELDVRGMDAFREKLAEKFGLLLGQLGIDRDNPETRLYDKSLSNIQSYYFLAHRAVSALSPAVRQPMAEILRDQLRLFWGLTSWELGLLPADASGATLFRCTDGELAMESVDGELHTETRPGWQSLPIQGARRFYGFLSFPRTTSGMQQTPLPMFVHMFAMCLDEQRKQASAGPGVQIARDIPFLMARLDEDGGIIDATSAFLETFGIHEIAPGLSARALLQEQLGISPLHFDASPGMGDASSGGIAFAPEEQFPATPVYIARSADKERAGGSHLLLGDIARMSPAQSLALMFPGFMNALFDSIRDQICLLDKNGGVLYASPPAASLTGKNIFTVSRPLSLSKEAWHPGLLSGLAEALTVQASVVVNGALEPLDMIFTPLAGSPGRRCLLVMRPVLPAPPPSKNRKGSLAPRHRDTLTGLYGYSQFHTLLLQAVSLAPKRHSSVGVVFCDIASLRQINNERGYAEGDAVLRHAAETVSAACRTGRDYPCRYGSDKFAVIVTGAGQPQMEALARAIHENTAVDAPQPYALYIGLALIAEDASAREGLEKAREACAACKNLERDFFWAE